MESSGQNSTPKRKAVEDAEERLSAGAITPAQPRKRASRACDNCKLKRWKCEGKVETDDACIACRNADVACTYVQPARKRGPAIGFRERQREEQERRRLEGSCRETPSSDRSGAEDLVGAEQGYNDMAFAPSRDEAGAQPRAGDAGRSSLAPPAEGQIRDIVKHRAPAHAHAGVPRPHGHGHGQSSKSPTGPHSRAPPRAAIPLLGLPRAMVDGLLGVYFTHVHNVWPLIYKSSFSPHTASPLLLLSMLAISACIAPPSPIYGHDAAKLYRMAESALHHRRDNGIDIIQAVVLLSLRQTGCGDKGSAFIYAGRACAMVLNSGLNLARKDAPPDSPEEQTRSRVFWNCYVLDKTLAEETGRSFLLPYRRCSTPFPSVNEVDELESWPPASFSSAPLPRSVRGIVPRRGYVISCFVWTCRLAKVVEEILDLEFVEATGEDEWDRQFRESGEARRGLLSEAQEAERISEQLKLWRDMLPRHLQIDDKVSPMPHHAISLAWHTTSTIMLHSRYVSKIPRALPQPTSPTGNSGMEIVANSHDICSEAAITTVDMLRALDKYGLMEQLSSDIIHILSLVTLFLAFDSTSPDPRIASRAKQDFQQSCTWLRALTASWPAASAHKLFFEAVIEGGMKLADTEAGYDDRASPLQSTVAMQSPGLSGGLQAVRRHLSVSTASKPALPLAMATPTLSSLSAQPPAPIDFSGLSGMGVSGTSNGQPAGAGGMMLLPHIYWNQLSTAGATTQNPLLGLDLDHDFGTGNFGFNTMSSGMGDPGTTIGGSSGSYDDFSFGLATWAQNARMQEAQQQQAASSAAPAIPARPGDSSSFAAISPTSGPANIGLPWIDESIGIASDHPQKSKAGGQGVDQAYGAQAQQGGQGVSVDPWLSPTDRMGGFNFLPTGAGSNTGPSADKGALGRTETDVNTAAMLKQDQSAITAALMKFMADMRNPS